MAAFDRDIGGDVAHGDGSADEELIRQSTAGDGRRVELGDQDVALSTDGDAERPAVQRKRCWRPRPEDG